MPRPRRVLLVSQRQRRRGDRGRVGLTIVLRQDQQVRKTHATVAVGVALGEGGGGFAVVLGEDEQVGEVLFPVAVEVGGETGLHGRQLENSAVAAGIAALGGGAVQVAAAVQS